MCTRLHRFRDFVRISKPSIINILVGLVGAPSVVVAASLNSYQFARYYYCWTDPRSRRKKVDTQRITKPKEWSEKEREKSEEKNIKSKHTRNISCEMKSVIYFSSLFLFALVLLSTFYLYISNEWKKRRRTTAKIKKNTHNEKCITTNRNWCIGHMKVYCTALRANDFYVWSPASENFSYGSYFSLRTCNRDTYSIFHMDFLYVWLCLFLVVSFSFFLLNVFVLLLFQFHILPGLRAYLLFSFLKVQ